MSAHGAALAEPGPGRVAPAPSASPQRRAAARHLYVHLPFCASRCGYCDFVTVVGHDGLQGAYVEALLAELELSRELLAPELETVFLGGGTPTLTEWVALERLLRALPSSTGEVTVEANPETMTAELAGGLREAGVSRVSLGAQSFEPRLLAVLERRARPDDVRCALRRLRAAGLANVNLDLIYGIPGQTPADLARDLDAALALEPEHLSCYELEAKPGTRFTHAHGDELGRQAEAMEGYFELVVERLTGAGYRWYETANFCRTDAGRDLRAQHNLGYWLGRDYLGLGLGAVSTIGYERWRTTPRLPAYLAALGGGELPPRELEPLDPGVRARERVLLGLRLDEPLPVAGLEEALDEPGLERMERLGLVQRTPAGMLALTTRGRYLGGGVTAELIAG
jgi:oxygen-independent coproporphyrinogen III oxidase